MALKGTLKEFDVPDILQLISLQKKTGVLTFTRKDGFITLLFEKGLIAGVDAFPKKLGQRYGSVLVKQGKITGEQLEQALVVQKKTNQKLGEILKEMGAIDEAIITEALKTQATEIIFSLFKWKHAEYHFKVYESINSELKTLEPIPTDSIIMEGVQMLDEWPLIKEAIRSDMIVFEPVPITSSDIRLVDDFDEVKPQEEGKVDLTSSEAEVIKYVNGRRTVRDLVSIGLYTEYKVYKCLMNLSEKGIIKEKKISRENREKVIDLQEYQISDRRFFHQPHNLLYLLAILFLLIFILSFSRPFKPFGDHSVFNRSGIFQNLLAGIE